MSYSRSSSLSTNEESKFTEDLSLEKSIKRITLNEIAGELYNFDFSPMVK